MTYRNGSNAGRPMTNFAVAIDGIMDQAYVVTCNGGETKREVFTHKMGAAIEQPKSLGGKLKVSPVKIKCSLAMGRQLLDWINQAFQGNPMYKDLVIYEADQSLRTCRTVSAHRCLITEVNIPAMDAGSNEATYVEITLQPEWVDYDDSASPGPVLQANQGSSKAKDWVCTNFTFEVQGMGNEANQVVKLDSFVWKAVVKEDATCNDKYPAWCMTGFEMPQLKITYNPSLNQYFDSMYNQFVRDGVAGDTAHRWADLTFMDLAHNELSSLRFSRMGLLGSPSGSYDAGGQDIARKTCELYFSMMQFDGLQANSFDQ